jgi:hypothetical protein
MKGLQYLNLLQVNKYYFLNADVVFICVVLIYNGELIVVKLFIVVTPDTFNDDINVVELFNVVDPDTFNDDINVVELFNNVVPDIFDDDKTVVLVAIKLYASISYNPELFILEFIYYMLV